MANVADARTSDLRAVGAFLEATADYLGYGHRLILGNPLSLEDAARLTEKAAAPLWVLDAYRYDRLRAESRSVESAGPQDVSQWHDLFRLYDQSSRDGNFAMPDSDRLLEERSPVSLDASSRALADVLKAVAGEEASTVSAKFIRSATGYLERHAAEAGELRRWMWEVAHGRGDHSPWPPRSR